MVFHLTATLVSMTHKPIELAPRVLSWASIIDQNTADQAAGLGRLDFVSPHIALMPDAHSGKGTAIGTVIPTVGAVIPAAVGVDIGCGMAAVRTIFTADDIAQISLEQLRDEIERSIPLSPGNYNKKIHREHTKARIQELEELAECDDVDLSHSPKWREQLGSLGGGNHFIELCLDGDNNVWCFLHSGSRGVGNKIAQKHIKIATREIAEAGVELAEKDHAYLREGTESFDTYLRELAWAQRFARLNRDEMMDRFVDQLARMMRQAHDDGHISMEVPADSADTEVERVNCHHNYTEKVTINDESVWLTRKGAIDASVGKFGLIPGSMGARSYVVRGRGNAAGLNSAPHGAGRVMSRRQAKKQYTAEDLANRMGDIVYRPGEQWVDEIPDAYKPIDQVMADAEDLVEVVTELRQVLNVKGT